MGHCRTCLFTTNVKIYFRSLLFECYTHRMMTTLKCSHQCASYRETDAVTRPVNNVFKLSAISGPALPVQVKPNVSSCHKNGNKWSPLHG